MYRLAAIITIPLLLAACKNSGNSGGNNHNSESPEDSSSNGNHLTVNDFAIVEPVKKFIYYMNDVDITTYDSISTQYFHEVMDYTDTAAIAIEMKIHELEMILVSDTTTEIEKHVTEEQISELSLELYKYEKNVTGYVFVHTFLNMGDTLSAIIITNADMTKGEAIQVSTPNDIEPTAFTSNIRKIDQ